MMAVSIIVSCATSDFEEWRLGVHCSLERLGVFADVAASEVAMLEQRHCMRTLEYKLESWGVPSRRIHSPWWWCLKPWQRGALYVSISARQNRSRGNQLEVDTAIHS